MYFFGVLWTAVSVGFLRETAFFEDTHIAFFLFGLTVIYGVIGFRLSSMLVWIFALLSFAAWGWSRVATLPGRQTTSLA